MVCIDEALGHDDTTTADTASVPCSAVHDTDFAARHEECLHEMSRRHRSVIQSLLSWCQAFEGIQVPEKSGDLDGPDLELHKQRCHATLDMKENVRNQLLAEINALLMPASDLLKVARGEGADMSCRSSLPLPPKMTPRTSPPVDNRSRIPPSSSGRCATSGLTTPRSVTPNARARGAGLAHGSGSIAVRSPSTQGRQTPRRLSQASANRVSGTRSTASVAQESVPRQNKRGFGASTPAQTSDAASAADAAAGTAWQRPPTQLQPPPRVQPPRGDAEPQRGEQRVDRQGAMQARPFQMPAFAGVLRPSSPRRVPSTANCSPRTAARAGDSRSDSAATAT
eukprot:TRINITY_DN18692_c0_g1_i1.p1 TRINITY_DN18692_c0_g1~~TRINITY_DN18692_c0_g1_i1.p1  ORF type:complete len:348 (+),score=39.52 TRINITY_DN18692_c0_g1_i1:29-1045(+)